jgi:hypothetical protein
MWECISASEDHLLLVIVQDTFAEDLLDYCVGHITI